MAHLKVWQMYGGPMEKGARVSPAAVLSAVYEAVERGHEVKISSRMAPAASAPIGTVILELEGIGTYEIEKEV